MSNPSIINNNNTTTNKAKKVATLTPVDYGRLRFLIADCPDEKNMSAYLDSIKEYKISHVARACEPTYSTTQLVKAGIQVHEFFFEDGSIPPPDTVKRWLELVDRTQINERSPDYLSENQRILVHCVAGLGRAPVLVTVALIEAGMDPLEAAQFVRERRKGALNTPQLHWLESYHRITRWKNGGTLDKRSTCVIC
jgi:protein tyrosine phosphatase type 4A